MNRKTRITAIFVLICIVFSLCSCKGGDPDARIYLSIEKMPETLDAQVAESDIELMIARNIYEGLTRQTSKGEIVLAAAEKYDFSGLTYTFRLKDNLKWADGEPLLAEDFVFGIKRAILPETKAPFARLLYSIKGAEQANNGLIPVDDIGITAVDEKTLKIELNAEDKEFLKVLSMPVCMPCREDFFKESTGKYGLEKECVLANGSYYLAKWNKETDGIRLYKNEQYTGDFSPENGGVFISKDKERTVAERLVGGYSDMAILPSEYLPQIKGDDIKTVSVQNICWVLSLGGDFSANIRRAFCECISGDDYGKDLPTGFALAKSIFPECIKGAETTTETVINYNPTEAQSIISEEIKQFKNKKFPQTTLIYSESEPMRPVITEIVGNWQENLSTFINIKSTDNPLQSELKEHSLPLSVFPVKADSTQKEYLYKFEDDYYNGYSLMPIAFENTTIGYLESLEGVSMNPTGGYVDFSYIVKK